MSRAIAFLALFAVLTLRFVDGAAHASMHEHETPSQAAVVLLDQDGDCSKNDFHAAAHCASHMADAMQRAVAMSPSHSANEARLAPLAWTVLRDGRSLSPPVRPPLA